MVKVKCVILVPIADTIKHKDIARHLQVIIALWKHESTDIHKWNDLQS